jgi:hypothetical protein
MRAASWTCGKCGAQKVLIGNGTRRCMPCTRRREQLYYATSASRREAVRRRHIHRAYGTTLEFLESLLNRQSGRCAICKKHWQDCKPAKTPRYERLFLHHLYVDHHHRTGTIRGVLCNACNTAIARLGEDISVAVSALKYLGTHSMNDLHAGRD